METFLSLHYLNSPVVPRGVHAKRSGSELRMNK